MRYDDLDDDFDVGPPRDSENATSAGMIGFIFAVVSIGLLVVVAVLWTLLDHDQQQARNVDQKRWLLYWFLFLDMLSFFAALVAVIMGGRGLTPTNPLYRGWSMTALILGILEIIATIIFGIFMTCFVLLFEALGGR
jgi:magnesium-transporting ATPase (P-type)